MKKDQSKDTSIYEVQVKDFSKHIRKGKTESRRPREPGQRVSTSTPDDKLLFGTLVAHPRR